MSKSGKPSESEKLDLMQIISLVLSVYILGSLITQTLFRLSPQTTDLLNVIDNGVCVFFLYDFFVRLYKAESKLQFLKWGWIDFISSIPVFGFFQWARIARVIRIIRILRAFRSTKILLQFIFRNRSMGTLATAATGSLLMMIFSAIAMLNVENAPDSNIKTPEDAIWWAFTTITTVGYGDKYPVTTEGRIVAAMLMISSVGLFGVFTAYVASFFVAENQKKGRRRLENPHLGSPPSPAKNRNAGSNKQIVDQAPRRKGPGYRRYLLVPVNAMTESFPR